MFHEIVITGTITVHLLLSLITVGDTVKRGHTSWSWFLCVLVLGVVGAIIYLLVRNCTKLPKEEQQDPFEQITS